jgi:hypothetical protein
VTPRSTILLVVVLWQPSYQLKNHYQKVKLVGLVTVVQPDSSDPDQTIPAAPPEVPELEVAAVRPLWPARLQPAPRPPEPTTAYRQCSVTVLISLNLVSIGILLEVMHLRLEIHDPLKMVTSF